MKISTNMFDMQSINGEPKKRRPLLTFIAFKRVLPHTTYHKTKNQTKNCNLAISTIGISQCLTVSITPFSSGYHYYFLFLYLDYSIFAINKNNTLL
uniref:Uncharacterized protein n=1 Tax=Romanomermis culicivorax TaxID=13658 RepID=A0A915I089_ROMCU